MSFGSLGLSSGRGQWRRRDEATMWAGMQIDLIDLSAGSSQEYVEDCPVCCRPNVIHVEVDDGGDVRVWAQRE